jgi:PhnB protein
VVVRGPPRAAPERTAPAANVVPKNEAPSGTVGHAKVCIGDSVLECSEAHGMGPQACRDASVRAGRGCGVSKTARSAGATSLSEPKDQFYGERKAGVMDASGNHWYIATHKEDPTTEELMSRGAAREESVEQ